VKQNSSNQIGSASNNDIYSNAGGNSFMRPMSPIQVDYATEGSKRVFTPTSHFTSSTNNNLSIDDPYTHQSVSFAMMEPSSKRYNVQTERSGSPFSQQNYSSNNSDLGTLSKARTNDIRDPLSSDWLKQSSSDRRI
jgi:hypothetical protein